MENISLTNEQQRFFDAVMEGKSVFLNGKAGTGKTTVVKMIMKEFDKKRRKYAAVAPTGIAATNLGGATMHSLFALPVDGVIDYGNCRHVKRDKRRIYDSIETLIIDEISMVRADMLDGIDYTLRKNDCDPLSSKQIIMIGDMKQLPPVADDNFKTVMSSQDFEYAGVGIEYSKFLNLNRDNFVFFDLNEVKRQDDEEFVTALNIVREGGKSPYFKQFLNRGIKGVILTPYRDTVSKYNVEGLSSVEGELFTFRASVDGKASANDFNLDNIIQVKHGCKIMYLINSKNNNLVNGTLGTFLAEWVDEHEPVFNEEGDVVRYNKIQVRKFFIQVGNIKYPLDKVTLSKKQYVLDEELDMLVLETTGSITQYPFRLAYALTIHKSQGLTLDEVTIDLSRPCFEQGQLYVALSRVRTPEGLSIITGDRVLKI